MVRAKENVYPSVAPGGAVRLPPGSGPETQHSAVAPLGSGRTPPLRLGIVGLGWVARDFMLPAIAETAGAKLVAVCDLHEPAPGVLPKGVSYFAELAEMLSQKLLDAVYIATPNHLHVRQATACLEAGVAVLCEKPMAPTAAEADEIGAAVAKTGTPYATAFDQRHHPAHVRMRELVAAGELGTLTQIRLDYACWLPGDWSPDAATGGTPAPDNWRIDRARAGGGAVIDLAPHGLDLVETISGQRIEQLAGYLQHSVHAYATGNTEATRVDDGGVLIGSLSGGALLTHSVGYNRPERLPRRRLELIGTKGMLVAENTMGQTAGGTLVFTDAQTGGARAVGFDVSRSPFTGQLEAFLGMVRGHFTTRDVHDDLRLAHLLESAMTGGGGGTGAETGSRRPRHP